LQPSVLAALPPPSRVPARCPRCCPPPHPQTCPHRPSCPFLCVPSISGCPVWDPALRRGLWVLPAPCSCACPPWVGTVRCIHPEARSSPWGSWRSCWSAVTKDIHQPLLGHVLLPWDAQAGVTPASPGRGLNEVPQLPGTRVPSPGTFSALGDISDPASAPLLGAAGPGTAQGRAVAPQSPASRWCHGWM